MLKEISFSQTGADGLKNTLGCYSLNETGTPFIHIQIVIFPQYLKTLRADRQFTAKVHTSSIARMPHQSIDIRIL